jgi:O-acetyl-ADP-ribose deacetylase (regulator of RNase III)
MSVKRRKGDLLKSKAKYIVHQTNCVTSKGAGLSKIMFEKFPHSDIYSNNTKRTPSQVIVRGDGVNKRYVINICGQKYPGSPKYSNDGYYMRKEWFKKALDKILEIEDLESIAFPYGIGCGLAGGNWNDYKEMIKQFASKCNAEVYIYKLQSPNK